MYKLFLIEQTNQVQFQAIKIEPGCQGGQYHRGKAIFGIAQAGLDTHTEIPKEAWFCKVVKCDQCGYVFADSKPSALSSQREWIRKDTGETHWDVRDFGPGACFYADWLTSYFEQVWDNWHGGAPLQIQMPNNDSWMPESRASNCTLPEDRQHRCWCLHGEFPNLTADKNGLTCNAGAGSIATTNWHGFLRNGELVL